MQSRCLNSCPVPLGHFSGQLLPGWLPRPLLVDLSDLSPQGVVFLTNHSLACEVLVGGRGHTQYQYAFVPKDRDHCATGCGVSLPLGMWAQTPHSITSFLSPLLGDSAPSISKLGCNSPPTPSSAFVSPSKLVPLTLTVFSSPMIPFLLKRCIP